MGCYKNNFMGNSKHITHHAHHVIHTCSGDESKKFHVFNNICLNTGNISINVIVDIREYLFELDYTSCPNSSQF